MSELDRVPVNDLTSRYGVAKSNIYNRMEGLKIKPEKAGKQSFLNAQQIVEMDRLNDHLKAGGTIADFDKQEESYSPTGISYSYRTEDTGMARAIAGQIAQQIVDTLREQPPPPQLPPADPLADLRTLQEACDQGWHLSSSQLAPLLGLKSLHGDKFQRFGFRFTKTGRNGAESAWKIEKL